MSSWANLPADLLLLIADKLDVTTSIRLSSVCISWASTILPGLPSFPPFLPSLQSIPWLLCSAKKSNTTTNTTGPGPNRSESESESHDELITFYDFSTAAYYSVRIPIPSFSFSFSFCVHQWLGSYKGWLVTLDNQLQLHLIKPLTGAHVLLPSNGIEKELPKKVILCHRPDNTNELQAFCLTQDGNLFSIKLGDGSWTLMGSACGIYMDIIVYQGKLYVVSNGILSYWNLQSSSIEKKMVIRNGNGDCWGWTKYLLEWNGELVMLMIDDDQEEEERISLENYTPNQVKLYQLQIIINVSLSLVTSLREDALIVGDNCSYIMSSSCHNGIQPNSIYFIHQFSHCFHDAETSQSQSNHYLGKQAYNYKPCCLKDSPMHMTSPIWFWPC
ncbi:uncharacterized protein LOC144544284 [Carex rostrata]